MITIQMYKNIGVVVVVIVWWLALQLPMQSVPITNKAGSSNPAHGEVYSIQHYVIKFIGDLRQVDGFSTNKTDRHNITDILLKVALNTIAIVFNPSSESLLFITK